MFDEIADALRRRRLSAAAAPTFPITEAVDAFRFMAQGKHVGKNVLTFDHAGDPDRLYERLRTTASDRTPPT